MSPPEIKNLLKDTIDDLGVDSGIMKHERIEWDKAHEKEERAKEDSRNIDWEGIKRNMEGNQEIRTELHYLQKKENEDVDKSIFCYPGPKPYSKETAILMMADSVEAASKSLQEPTAEGIASFVQKIIEEQAEENQFDEADISLREIELIKKILIEKLINVYHLREVYPE